MDEIVKQSDRDSLVETYTAIRDNVTLPNLGEEPDLDAVKESIYVRKIQFDILREAVNKLEVNFSNNCNCLTNPDCCQTCQSQTCQSQSCQSQTCQTCQSQCGTCQSCQSCQSVATSDSH